MTNTQSAPDLQFPEIRQAPGRQTIRAARSDRAVPPVLLARSAPAGHSIPGSPGFLLFRAAPRFHSDPAGHWGLQALQGQLALAGHYSLKNLCRPVGRQGLRGQEDLQHLGTPRCLKDRFDQWSQIGPWGLETPAGRLGLAVRLGQMTQWRL